ncbi:MAG: pilin [Elusimicrobia bacterium]|nr:pilin [Elusimicrobiota bacterium]
MYQKRGFTLIELLVVVLIIGILSAVALPQYQKAVEKSRTAQAFTLARALHTAQEEYKMSNGAYTRYFDDLSVSTGLSSSGTNTCGLQAPDIRYSKDFAVVLGTTEQYLGDVAVVRNDGKYQCYAIGFIEDKMYCSEYPGMHKESFCSKAFAGKFAFSTPNWNHYELP